MRWRWLAYAWKKYSCGWVGCCTAGSPPSISTATSCYPDAGAAVGGWEGLRDARSPIELSVIDGSSMQLVSARNLHCSLTGGLHTQKTRCEGGLEVRAWERGGDMDG